MQFGVFAGSTAGCSHRNGVAGGRPALGEQFASDADYVVLAIPGAAGTTPLVTDRLLKALLVRLAPVLGPRIIPRRILYGFRWTRPGWYSRGDVASNTSGPQRARSQPGCRRVGPLPYGEFSLSAAGARQVLSLKSRAAAADHPGRLRRPWVPRRAAPGLQRIAAGVPASALRVMLFFGWFSSWGGTVWPRQ